jgi:hypothetical protein
MNRTNGGLPNHLLPKAKLELFVQQAQKKPEVAT